MTEQNEQQPGEVQIARVTWITTADGMARITLDGKPIGPTIPATDAEIVMRWFLGYLEQRAREAIGRLGLTAPTGRQPVMRAAHTVPTGRCPTCGKMPNHPTNGPIVNPCPTCRQ